MSLKQPDGSFLVARHAEVDVRGIYCLLVVATLLDLLTPALVAGTASFIASCQTYEGGFSSASQPYYAVPPSPPSAQSDAPRLLENPRPPLGEAHGGYTFCATAAWVLLRSFHDASVGEEAQPNINVTRLLRWLVMMQGTEIELGGFKGRTNKLVDGCYSWWCGSAFALVEALGVSAAGSNIAQDGSLPTDEEGWDDIDGKISVPPKAILIYGWMGFVESLFDRKALQEYILYAGQHPAGGLRDKPPK
ncbi:hypothetical protein H0H81_009697 [Sphagnurus paluster]|uniref:Prenyltransferase alpha-alpha toroid domain-containing protein n=1 Tax=Sphagnurus paluster TaxID=117069 RepID=A0A9P7GUZ5_9AGAR|nr:hypothetical protein H0H81_009697 [Sphagnurus paluster]